MQRYDFKGEPVASRLDDPPIVVLGYSAIELLWASLSLTLGPGVVGGLLGALLGDALIGIAVSLVIGGIAIYLVGLWLGGVKEGKPINYHTHKNSIMLRHVFGTAFVYRQGTWDIGRR